MKIAVQIKQVPATEEDRHLAPNGSVDRSASERVADEITERALEVALKEKDADKTVEIVAVTMGPAGATEALRKALSMGADSAIHIVDDALAGSDALTTAKALGAGLKGVNADVIIAGNESTDGRGGVVPAMLAELLGLPFLGPLNSVEFTGSSARGQRQGVECTQDLAASLPAVLSITERTGEARFPKFKGIMTAKRKPVVLYKAADLGLGGISHADGNLVLASSKRPARGAGTKIVDDGNAAVHLADYLSNENLI